MTVERQSSWQQVLDHKDSQTVQANQVEHAAAKGFRSDEVERVKIEGETAKPFAARPEFDERVLGRAAMGDVSHIFTLSDDRLYRNLKDHARLMQVAQEHHIKIVVDGKEYDPRNEDDELVLGLNALLAVVDGHRLSKKFGRNKVAAANDRTLRFNLINGLIWACPDDPDFAATAVAAGMADHLAYDAANVDKRLSVLRDGRRIAPFQVPDERAREAYRRVVDLFFAEGTVGGVCARIRGGKDWPAKAGKFPQASGEWRPGFEVEWVDVEFWRVCGFLESPATWGVYSIESRWMAARATTAEERERCSLRIEGAWTGYGTPDEYEQYNEIRDERVRERAAADGGPPKPKNHALARARCGEARADGARCGRTLGRNFAVNGVGLYMPYAKSAAKNAQRDHICPSVTVAIDDVVVRTVRELFSPAHVSASLDALVADAAAASSTSADGRRLTAHVNAAVTRVTQHKGALRRAEDALEGIRAGTPEHKRAVALRAEYEADLAAAVEARNAAQERQTTRLKDHAALAARAVRDAETIRRLAEDVPDLLSRAEAAERAGLLVGARRELLRALVRSVHVRRVGTRVCVLTIEFPTGECVERTAFTGAHTSSAAERAWAVGRAAEGATSAEIARELQAARTALPPILAAETRVPWSARKVDAVLSGHAKLDSPMRADCGESVSAVATRVGASAAAVLQSALRGRLGVAARYISGALWIAPSEALLHAAFPAYAARVVADDAGWKADDRGVVDAVPVPDLARETGRTYSSIVAWAGGDQALPRDLAGRRYASRRETLAHAAASAKRVDAALRGAVGRQRPTTSASEVAAAAST